MNRIIVPVAAVVGLFAANGLYSPCLAQSAGLPQTVMGKFVHMPGDNQYSNQTQSTRHGPPPTISVPMPAVANAGYTAPAWSPTPRPFRPDPSIEPIAADEPVSPQGFPPLPDRLDLPVALNWTSGGAGGGGGGGGYGGGGAGYGAGGGGGPAGPTDAAGQHIDSGPQGMHQHYQHYNPGAFMPPQAQATAAPQQRSGYYKCTTPEQFSSGGPAAAAAAPDANMQALRGLGKEPKLSDRNDQQQAAPEAPQAVVVNQATTQDLSLPEDEFQQKSPPSRNSGSNVMRRVNQMVIQRGLSAGQQMMSRGMQF